MKKNQKDKYAGMTAEEIKVMKAAEKQQAEIVQRVTRRQAEEQRKEQQK